jgi:hypothetical protein
MNHYIIIIPKERRFPETEMFNNPSGDRGGYKEHLKVHGE